MFFPVVEAQSDTNQGLHYPNKTKRLQTPDLILLILNYLKKCQFFFKFLFQKNYFLYQTRTFLVKLVLISVYFKMHKKYFFLNCFYILLKLLMQ